MLLFVSAPAFAGPWPRGEGKGFLSFGYEITADTGLPTLPLSESLTGYLEYGVNKRLTFVLDGNRDDDPESQGAIAQLRYSLSAAESTHQWALSGGVGNDTRASGSESMSVLGASWGRGFESRWGGGWATVDVQYRFGGDTSLGKVDGTLGIRPTDDSLVFGQIQISDPDTGETTARLSVNYVRDVSKRVKAEFGLLYGLANDDAAGVRSGLWLDF
jgi:hypothetical protein